ncbi:MAG: hypothetical protein AMJ53_18770 [Gammaproteobacteria bacterium SG8_11]|nr:MAG: hypothetical protein AMJ53_18770 [Gammaproteobacteria bacterium SG8_11]
MLNVRTSLEMVCFTIIVLFSTGAWAEHPGDSRGHDQDSPAEAIQDINVVNTPNVNVVNTPSVSAEQSGPWEVAVSSGTVTVDNDVNNPIPVTSMATGGYRFLGYSTQLVRGGATIAGMTHICQTDLNNQQARTCTTKELVESPNIPISGQAAWVHPYIVGIVYNPTTDKTIVVDYSGITIQNDAGMSGSCGGWLRAAPPYYGTAFVNGYFGTTGCDLDAFIACCGPQ